jgi:hypothetical protein
MQMSSLDAVSPTAPECHRRLALPATHSERAIAMTESITPPTTGLGWVIDMPLELTALLKVKPGSLAILYPKDGAKILL